MLITDRRNIGSIANFTEDPHKLMTTHQIDSLISSSFVFSSKESSSEKPVTQKEAIEEEKNTEKGENRNAEEQKNNDEVFASILDN